MPICFSTVVQRNCIVRQGSALTFSIPRAQSPASLHHNADTPASPCLGGALSPSWEYCPARHPSRCLISSGMNGHLGIVFCGPAVVAEHEQRPLERIHLVLSLHNPRRSVNPSLLFTQVLRNILFMLFS